MLCIASWLHSSHHELIFRRELLLHTLRLSELLHFVFDLVKLNSHLLRPDTFLSCFWALHLLFDELISHSVIMTLVVVTDGKPLLNEETHFTYSHLTLVVVDVDKGNCNFMGREDVLIEGTPHS